MNRHAYDQFTPDAQAREQIESLEDVNERNNLFLYGQGDPPANFRPEGKLTTAKEMEEMFLRSGWTIVRGSSG